MEWPAYVEGAELCLLVGYRLALQGILLGLPVPPLWLLAPLGPGLLCRPGGSWEDWPSLPGDGVCNLTGPERTELDFTVLEAYFHLGEKLLLLASASCSLVTW